MMRRLGYFVVAWTVMGCGAALDLYGQQLDSIQGASGATEFGALSQITRNEVSFDVRGVTKKYPVNELKRLTFGQEPKELRDARDEIGRDQFESARVNLSQIATAGITRREILADVDFYRAYCDAVLSLRQGGDKAAAVTALIGFIEKPENQQSHQYYTAVEMLGNLAVAMERYDKAVEYYGELAKAPWSDYQMHATVLEGRAQMASGGYPAALAKFDAVIASPADDALAISEKNMAQVGKAVCLANMDRAVEGAELVEKIIAANDSQANGVLFGRAYNALGRCYLRLGKPKDALMAYLHVDLLFNFEPDAHAEALYHLSQLWGDVNKPDRAIAAGSLLRSRYGGTVWAKQN